MNVEDLIVHKKSFSLAMDILQLSKNSPEEETNSLTDHIRLPSRSITVTISEAYRKRQYRKHFISKLTDSDPETG